jgi:4-carboxymuconolactone decarboxylase
MTTRKQLREQGEALRTQLFGSGAAPGDAAPGFRKLVDEAVYGGIWSRPGLGLADRMLCTLAALCAVRAHASLRRHVAAAVHIGLEGQAILEIFIQTGIYAGFSATEDAIEIASSIVKPASLPVDELAREALMQRGQALLQKLHGVRGQFGYAAPDNPYSSRLYPLAVEYGYGEIWHRPGLALRQRALVAVAGFTALRMEDPLKKFAQAALNAGLSRDEVVEALVQTAPASGFAPALTALRWLSEAV